MKWNVLYLYFEVHSYQYAIIGSDVGLAPKMRQAIIWTNVDLVDWRMHVSFGLNGFIKKEQNMNWSTDSLRRRSGF